MHGRQAKILREDAFLLKYSHWLFGCFVCFPRVNLIEGKKYGYRPSPFCTPRPNQPLIRPHLPPSPVSMQIPSHLCPSGPGKAQRRDNREVENNGTKCITNMGVSSARTAKAGSKVERKPQKENLKGQRATAFPGECKELSELFFVFGCPPVQMHPACLARK